MSNHENMDDKDFYAFRKSIEHEREIGFDESAWDDLKGRMDEAQSRKRRPLLGWWTLAAAAVVLPLVVGNLFLFSNLRETKKVNEQMQGKLEAFTKTERDTVWRERIVYVHDTLNTGKMVYRNVPVVPEKYRQLKSLLTDKDLETLLAGKLPDRLRDLPGETQPTAVENLANAAAQNLDNQAEAIDLNHVPDLLASKEMASLKSLHHAQPNWSALLPEAKLGEKKVSFLRKVEWAMTPKGLAVGANVGGLFPVGKELKKPGGWSSGIAAELVFSKNLSLRIEGNYAHISFTADEMNPDLGIPVIPKPGDDFHFEYAKVSQNALHFNLGMKYRLNPGKKLQPFVYAGYGTATMLPYTVNYVFENETLGGDFNIEGEENPSKFISGFGMAGLGLSFAFNDHFKLTLEGTYRRQFSQSGLSTPDLAGLRTGLTYQF